MKGKFLSKETKNIIWEVALNYKRKQKNSFDKLKIQKEELRDEIREIKENSIRNIEELKKKTIENLEKNDIKVFEAKDAKEAREIIEKIIANRRKIVKSKTNTFNEITNENFLAGKEVTETDLGDFLIQITGQKDFHPVLPALHLKPEKIVKLLKNKFSESLKPTPKAITSFVRKHLRKKIFEAEIGISGANVITSDGQIVILENEGNISLVSRIPDCHIVIAGFEKIVPTIEDAIKICQASTLWGTGQDFPVYISIISGPSKTADIQNKLIIGAQGAKEVYLILLDNGRNELIKQGFEEILYCLNCGACLNFCPVFHQIGQNFGNKYLGPKGIIFDMVQNGLKVTKESGLFSCSGCEICKQNCPAKINLPELLRKIREKLEKENLQTETNQEMIKNIRKFGNPFGKIPKGKIPKKFYCC